MNEYILRLNSGILNIGLAVVVGGCTSFGRVPDGSVDLGERYQGSVEALAKLREAEECNGVAEQQRQKKEDLLGYFKGPIPQSILDSYSQLNHITLWNADSGDRDRFISTDEAKTYADQVCGVRAANLGSVGVSSLEP
ncbi:hypothetical protein CMO92_02700 [Candidatus Woesearchaeota archaeon]|nr:hypothetical protein [Candidatus Woesearchaeota archaeon]